MKIKNNILGIKIKEMRTKKGLSQAKLAEMLGLKRQTLGSYEIGTREPNCDNLIKLGEALGVSIKYLLGEAEDTIISN